MLKGKEIHRPQADEDDEVDITSKREKVLMLVLGVGGLLFVPVLKTLTHLPPNIGMLFSLGVLWM